MSTQLKSWFFQITKTTTKLGTRFRSGDRPTSKTFQFWTNSAIFKSERDDKAKVDTGSFSDETCGHVVLATDAQSKSNTVQPSDRSLVVQPHQLPTVEDITVDEVFGGFTGKVLTSSKTAETKRNVFNLTISSGFKTWLLSRLLPSGGATGTLLTKNSSTSYDVSWSSALSSNLNWGNNLTTTSNVLAERNKGYVAEGGVISVLSLPVSGSGIPPVEGDKIGIGTDGTSGAEIRLDGSGTAYYTLASDQSAIFRYDSSLSRWLAESSHTPIDQTSSTSVYVDKFAGNGGNGSITLPFNTLELAITKVIGSGTRNAPELTGATIIVTAGTFNQTVNINLFIEGITWEFAKGVIINYSGSTYIIDNSSANQTSNFFIAGQLEFISNSAGGGFIYALGSSSASNNGIGRYISAEFFKINSVLPFSTVHVPLIKAECALTTKNAFKRLLDVSCTELRGNNCPELLHVGNFASVDFKGDISLSIDVNTGATAPGGFAQIRARLPVYINSAYYVNIQDAIITCTQISRSVLITGTNGNIFFTSVVFLLYSGENDNYRPNNVIRLSDTFSLADPLPGGSSSSFGLYFSDSKTNNNNFTSSNNTEIRYGYFCYKTNLVDTFVSFDADFNSCDVDGQISTFVLRFNSGGSFKTPFRSNIMSFNSSYTKTLRYFNIPTSATGLSSGSIWNNAGVLTIV